MLELKAPGCGDGGVDSAPVDRPRILYVCSCWPGDQAYGGQMRTLQIAKSLEQVGDVSVVVVGAETDRDEARRRTCTAFKLVAEVGVEPIRQSAVGSWLKGFFEPSFVNIHGVAVSEADERRIRELQAGFDLIWFSRLRTANYFRSARWPRSVIDVDDLPSAVEATAGARRASRLRRFVSHIRTKMLKRHESRLGHRFDRLVVCSEADRLALDITSPGKVHVVPNGYERPLRTPLPAPSAPPRIGFIGLFDYLPNSEGIGWFVAECLPLIRQDCPDVRIRLVGSKTDGPLKPPDPAVEGLGWIDDPTDEIASWAVMVVPIRIGGGTRIKIAEAFGRKCPVVSTRYGAYGYEVRDGSELRLADSAEDFARACVWAIRNPDAAREMADRAHEAFLRHWSWEAIGSSVQATARSVIGTRAAVNRT